MLDRSVDLLRNIYYLQLQVLEYQTGHVFNWVFCTITNNIASKQPFPSCAMFYNQMIMMKVWQTYRLLSHYQRKFKNIFTVWI